jgi:hypothetical protein
VTTKLTFTPGEHPGEDVFENYSFDRLSDQETADFEEHLLICGACQSALTQTDEYIVVIKAATAAYLTEHKGRLRPHFGKREVRWNVAAAAVILLTCLTALLSWRTPLGEPQTITLDAYRGAASEAPAGQALELNVDLKDLPPEKSFRLEVVDATGLRVWSGETPARLTKGLSPGVYWVRLIANTGEILREYGLSAVKSK